MAFLRGWDEPLHPPPTTTVLLPPVFFVDSVTPSKIKIKTIQCRRFRFWEMKEGKYEKRLDKKQVCEIFNM